MLPDPRHRGLTTMRTLFTYFLNGELRREHEVQGTPRQTYTNSVPDQHSLYPVRQHTLAFYTKCVTPVGQLLALARWGLVINVCLWIIMVNSEPEETA